MWRPLTGAALAPSPHQEQHLASSIILSVHEFHLGAGTAADFCAFWAVSVRETAALLFWRRERVFVGEMQGGVLSVVASGQAIAAGSLALGSTSVAHSGHGSYGVLAVARKPFGSSTLAVVSNSRSLAFDCRHSFPLGKRLRRSCLRVSALQQSTPVKWVLDPVGDGNTSHLDKPVPLPSGFEIASDAVTVGRVKDRVDVVIPVATVSGVHARLEKRDGQLFVTDLDSTNGTFINDKRIRPGSVTSVPPGSYITFGDEHLAVFRFLKLEEQAPSAEAVSKLEEPPKAPSAEGVPEEPQAQDAEA